MAGCERFSGIMSGQCRPRKSHSPPLAVFEVLAHFATERRVDVHAGLEHTQEKQVRAHVRDIGLAGCLKQAQL